MSTLGDVLISQPYLAFIPAIILAILFYVRRKKIIGVSALLWGVYGVYEALNLLRITCSGECNIRVDLLLIYPILIILTIASAVQFFLPSSTVVSRVRS